MKIYELAEKIMNDSEFNSGGIIDNEREYLDSVGFEYSVKDGEICELGRDLADFYNAMETLRRLNIKYNKE